MLRNEWSQLRGCVANRSRQGLGNPGLARQVGDLRIGSTGNLQPNLAQCRIATRWMSGNMEHAADYYSLAPSGVQMSNTAYGVYHGRFIESMLTHCDKLFTETRATAMPTIDDIVW